ncbi:hypothetical protein [Rhizobium sp. BK176]|uniref:hypothetical protein n=1 Tax=Rhizobium sp. BK176 TaxID=2587071 RepID=UPI002169A435|nr:hypothetical protein [Rhizobium sp. BK176]MCS4088662.1 hypothetical protein [Rhizobium sp. BK176]
MLDTSGRWSGHFWIEGVVDCGASVIVDLTADQFGYDPVILADRDDDRYRCNILSSYEPLNGTERKWGYGLFMRAIDTTEDFKFAAAA